jgi:hypothetical protein
MADRVTVAELAAAADDELAAVFADPPWRVQMGGPPDVADGGMVWCEVAGTTAAPAPNSRAEAVTLRCVAAVRSRTNAPERADQLDAIDRFITLAAGWPPCTRHVLTVADVQLGGVDTPAVVAVLTALASPC